MNAEVEPDILADLTDLSAIPDNHADAVWALLEQGAIIYVCGDGSRMAPDVRAAFATIYRAKTGADADQAEQWLRDLDTQGRYLTDVWASS